MEYLVGIVTAIAVLVLVLGSYIGRPGQAAKMLAGGVAIAGAMFLAALILDRVS